jgi:hypothetical protein
MDHAEVLERIELAAAEPDGLARLVAGDTPASAAIAGHLAGCEACAAELSRTARVATLAREAIRELPEPNLRARTLAFVREVGVQRSSAAGPGGTDAQVDAGEDAPAAPTSELAGAINAHSRRRSMRRRTAWSVAVGVAAVIVAAVAGFAAGGVVHTGLPEGQAAAARTTLHIAEQPDAVIVALAPIGGGVATGAVMYSVASGELSMIVSGLDPAPSGASYACWVEQGGQRQRIGVLYLEGGEGSWAGMVSGLGSIGAGARFGVSLSPDGTPGGTPVLAGGR